MTKETRRAFLTWFAAIAGASIATPASAQVTPRAAEGPFYPTPKMRFADTDNDLVKITGLVEEAGGEVITLSGRILDKNGAPRANHRVEIWQCDVNGKYLHTGDRNPAPQDVAFQGFGHDITDEDGVYTFRTIKPVSYPGRTPHIHVKVLAPDGSELLTTQFYEAGNPDNARDGLFRRMSDRQAKAVSMAYENGEAKVDVVV